MKKVLLALTPVLMQGAIYAQEVEGISGNTDIMPQSSIMMYMMGLIPLVIGLVCFMFWVRMLIDIIKNDHKDRTLWIIIMLLTGVIGSIIYYFVVRGPRKKAEKEAKKAQETA